MAIVPPFLLSSPFLMLLFCATKLELSVTSSFVHCLFQDSLCCWQSGISKMIQRFWPLRRNPPENWVILIFSGQLPCTRIMKGTLYSFLHFSRAKKVVICNNTKENLLWEPKKMKVKFYKITSCTWNFQNFTFVFTILVKCDIPFLRLPWEIVFGVITDD